jgi:hypothetical protein
MNPRHVGPSSNNDHRIGLSDHSRKKANDSHQLDGSSTDGQFFSRISGGRANPTEPGRSIMAKVPTGTAFGADGIRCFEDRHAAICQHTVETTSLLHKRAAKDGQSLSCNSVM